MDEAYLGEIRIICYNSFIPRNFVLCDGRLLSIQQYTALYSLLGAQFGGNGSTTFGVPDLRSRIIVSQGQGNGLSQYPFGTAGGAESVPLQINQMPTHNHTYSMLADNVPGTTNDPTGGHIAQVYNTPGNVGYDSFTPGAATDAVKLATQSTDPIGGGAAHPNLQPYMVLNYIICAQGIYPSRPD